MSKLELIVVVSILVLFNAIITLLPLWFGAGITLGMLIGTYLPDMMKALER